MQLEMENTKTQSPVLTNSVQLATLFFVDVTY